jgi:hypothetical protein
MIAGTGLREVRVTHPMRPSDSMVGLVPAALQGRLGQDVEIRPRSRSSRRKARALAGLAPAPRLGRGQAHAKGRAQAASAATAAGLEAGFTVEVEEEVRCCLSSSHALSLWAQALSLLLWLMKIEAIPTGSR